MTQPVDIFEPAPGFSNKVCIKLTIVLALMASDR